MRFGYIGARMSFPQSQPRGFAGRDAARSFALYAQDATLAGLFAERAVADRRSLAVLLEALLHDTVARIELPVIRWAYECSVRNDAKGLAELDRFLSSLPVPDALRAASRKVGRQQLRNFAPIKGHKFLRKYSAEVDDGNASGAQPIVYGMYLFLFSIPLREGLLSYAYQTVNGFAAAAARSAHIELRSLESTVAAACADLPKLVEHSLMFTREQLSQASASPGQAPGERRQSQA